MKCPKCGYTSFDYLESCKKCQQNLTAFKEKFGLRSLIFPGRLSAPVPKDDVLSREVPEIAPETATDFGYDLDDAASSVTVSQAVGAAAERPPSSSDEEFDFSTDWGTGAEESLSSEPGSGGFEMPEDDFSISEPSVGNESNMPGISEFSFDEEEESSPADSETGEISSPAASAEFDFDFEEKDIRPEAVGLQGPDEDLSWEESSSPDNSFGEEFESASELLADEAPLEVGDEKLEFDLPDFQEPEPIAPFAEEPEAAQEEPLEEFSFDELNLPGTDEEIPGFDAPEPEPEQEQPSRQQREPEGKPLDLSFDELSVDPLEEVPGEEKDPFAVAFDEMEDFDELDFSEDELKAGEDEEDPRDPFERAETDASLRSPGAYHCAGDTDSMRGPFEEPSSTFSPEEDPSAEAQDPEDEEPSPIVRLAATGVDLGLLAGVLLVFFWVGQKILASGDVPELFPPLQTLLSLATPYFLVLFVSHFIYFTLFHFMAGQTPGKMLFRICVVDTEDGGGLSPGQAFLRSAGGLLSVLCLGAGFFPVFRGGGLSWNDRIAGTRTTWAQELLED